MTMEGTTSDVLVSCAHRIHLPISVGRGTRAKADTITYVTSHALKGLSFVVYAHRNGVIVCSLFGLDE